jgi:hypothetical protein
LLVQHVSQPQLGGQALVAQPGDGQARVVHEGAWVAQPTRDRPNTRAMKATGCTSGSKRASESASWPRAASGGNSNTARTAAARVRFIEVSLPGFGRIGTGQEAHPTYGPRRNDRYQQKNSSFRQMRIEQNFPSARHIRNNRQTRRNPQALRSFTRPGKAILRWRAERTGEGKKDAERRTANIERRTSNDKVRFMPGCYSRCRAWYSLPGSAGASPSRDASASRDASPFRDASPSPGDVCRRVD